MSNLAYFTLDALLAVIAIAIVWAVFKKFFSILKATRKIASHSLNVLSQPSNHRDRVVFVKRVERIKGLTDLRHRQSTSSSTTTETKQLTQFDESFDWSKYDVPTYIRQGIVVH